MTWQESYQQGLDNNELVTWVEPDYPNQKECVVCFRTAQECVLVAKEVAGHKFTYDSELKALADFIAVHWASFSL